MGAGGDRTAAEAAPWPGQFLLQEGGEVPTGWASRHCRRWHLAHHPDLPVTAIVDATGAPAGWVLGHATLGRRLLGVGDVTTLPSSDPADVERELYRLGGRWAAVVVLPELERTYLDPAGTLSVVHAPELRRVASTPTVALHDHPGHPLAQRREGSFPNDRPNQFFVGEQTGVAGFARLLPNHHLDLVSMAAARHHPSAPRAACAPGDVDATLEAICDGITDVLQAVAASTTPLYLPLTAGRDSRMVLACARGLVDRCTFVTFDYRGVAHTRGDSTDVHVARRMAAQFSLRHRELPVHEVGEEARLDYLRRTGWATTSGKARDPDEAARRHLDLQGAWLPAFGGEVGRGARWRDTDREDTPIDAPGLLARIRPGEHPGQLEAADRWLDGVRHLDTLSVIDLAFMEFRFGVWASPQFYGTAPFAVQLVPFCHRDVFEAMYRLPAEFRRRQGLPEAVVAARWPELAAVPYQRSSGFRRLLELSDRAARTAARSMPPGLRMRMRRLVG